MRPARVPVLETAIPSNECVAELYRFVVLMQGCTQTASEVILGIFTESALEISQFRNETNCKVFLVRKARERCLKRGVPATAHQEGLPAIARRFAVIPEPERTALALFYTDLLPVAEIALLLDMSIPELADALESARSYLKDLDIFGRAASTAPLPVA